MFLKIYSSQIDDEVDDELISILMEGIAGYGKIRLCTTNVLIQSDTCLQC